MPLYEHRDTGGNIVERVRPVEGSREDQRLATSPNWTLVEESPAAEPATTATTAAAPAATVPTGPPPATTEAPRGGARSRKPS